MLTKPGGLQMCQKVTETIVFQMSYSGTTTPTHGDGMGWSETTTPPPEFLMKPPLFIHLSKIPSFKYSFRKYQNVRPNMIHC